MVKCIAVSSVSNILLGKTKISKSIDFIRMKGNVHSSQLTTVRTEKTVSKQTINFYSVSFFTHCIFTIPCSMLEIFYTQEGM